MILLSVQPFHALPKTLIPSCDNLDQSTIERPPFNNREVEDIFVIGTFKGIVLLVIKEKLQSHTIILYNLFTGAFEKVPDPPLISFVPPWIIIYQGSACTYGFCHGTEIDDLKIVRLTPPIHNTDYRCCDVFSFKNKSWSEPLMLEGCYKHIQDVGTFVNGFLYWSVHKRGFGRLIVALDINDITRYLEIELPRKCRYPVVALGKLDGHLCMVCCQDNGAACELWVMNEDVKTPWSKIWSSTILSRGIDLHKFRPQCVLNEGKIVMYKKPNQVVIYDVMKDLCTEVIETLTSELRRTQIIEYVENLVLPSDLFSSLTWEGNVRDA